MSYAHPPLKRHLGVAWRLLTAVAAVAMAPAAYATDFTETADFSDDAYNPTLLGSLTLGDNHVTGRINTFGDPVGPHGERTNQDMDYVTFTIPTGYVLTNFFVAAGTSISTAPRADNLFLGLYANPYTPVDSSFTSATGLLGWTLVPQSAVGTDILTSISNPLNDPTLSGFPVPGATTFTPPLGAGTYTLWLYDGDNPATYVFNLATAAVPEPATWGMMIAGFGAIGAGLRRRRANTIFSFA